MKRRNAKGEGLEIIVALLIIFVVFLPISYLQCKWESDTYNKLCGANTTPLDAAVAELRVDGTCRGGR